MPLAMRRTLETRGERAFAAFVGRSDDRRLERWLGSPRVLTALFGAMERRFTPDRADGFAGSIQFDLRTSAGALSSWTMAIADEAASARSGPAAEAKLTLKLTVADFLRLAAGDLEPGRALLSGRLDLEGDFAAAVRLGEMFGRAPLS